MYAKISNGEVVEYPYNLAKLREDNPNVSFPAETDGAVLAAFGVVEVQPVAPPSVGRHERYVESTPTISGGAWRQTYVTELRDNAGDVFAAAKADKRARVNSLRDTKEEGGAPTPFGVVDTNARSAKRLVALQGACVVSILTNTPWTTMTWTLADNSEVVLDTPAKGLQLTGAVVSYTNALHQYARTLKASVAALTFDTKDPAASFAALDAIDTEAGWPNG